MDKKAIRLKLTEWDARIGYRNLLGDWYWAHYWTTVLHLDKVWHIKPRVKQTSLTIHQLHNGFCNINSEFAYNIPSYKSNPRKKQLSQLK